MENYWLITLGSSHSKLRFHVLVLLLVQRSDLSQVANIRSYAQFAVGLYRVKAPDGIGSLFSFQSGTNSNSASVVLGPSVMGSDPPTVVPSITEYFKWLFQTRRLASSKLGTTEADLYGRYSGS